MLAIRFNVAPLAIGTIPVASTRHTNRLDRWVSTRVKFVIALKFRLAIGTQVGVKREDRRDRI